jgi:hypothetical protein
MIKVTGIPITIITLVYKVKKILSIIISTLVDIITNNIRTIIGIALIQISAIIRTLTKALYTISYIIMVIIFVTII